MISIPEHTSKIAQFDGTNFGNWKYRLSILLDEKGLRKFIEDELKNILRAEINQTLHGGIKKEERSCISIIVQSIHDSQLEYVKDKNTAKGMFDNICSVFERKSIAGQLLLRKQLLTLKIQEGDNINNHFINFDKKIRDLKSIDATMENMDIICHLLLTLPRSYENLVTAIETMNPNDLTLEFVKSRLIDEHGKRNNRGSSSNSNESYAMQMRNPNLLCFKCGKKGHIKSMCWSKSFTNKNSNPKSINKNDRTMNMASTKREMNLICKSEL